MKRFFRRKKKLIMRMACILAVLVFLILLIRYVLPSAGINTFNFNNDNSNPSSEVEVTIIDEPTVTVSLPEYITTVDDNSSKNEVPTSTETNTLVTSTTGTNGKSYTSYVDTNEKYFITVLGANNKLTLMLSNRAKDLLSKDSKAKVGVEYTVSNLKETIVGVYDFTCSTYKYPVLLLLSSSGKLYYVDLEASLKSGTFKAAGPIKKLSNIYKICPVEISDGNTSYKSAVLTDLDGIGYEFTLDMIGR